MLFDALAAQREQAPFFGLVQRALPFGVGVAVAHQLVTARHTGSDEFGAVVVQRGVEQRGAGQGELVEQFHAAPRAHAVAVLAPAVVQHVGRRTRPGRARRVARRVELVELHIGRHPEGHTRAVGPADHGPLVVGQVVVEAGIAFHRTPPGGVVRAKRVAVCSVLSGLDGGICLPPVAGCKTRFTRAMSLDFCSLVPGKGMSKRIPACCLEAPWQDAHSARSKGRTRCSKWSLELGFCPAAAIGSCAATVASVAMVRDLFPVKDIPKVFSLLMLVVGLSPMLAPTVGGYVTEDYGWHTVFFILMCMGIAILLASQIGLPNSYKPDTSISLKPKPIITNFINILKEPQFYTYAFTGAVAFSGLFTYVAASPILFMTIFKVDPKTYGWIFAFMSLSFISASQLNSLLLRRFKSEQMIFGALITQTILSIIFLVAALNNRLGLYETIAFLFLFLACLHILIPFYFIELLYNKYN